MARGADRSQASLSTSPSCSWRSTHMRSMFPGEIALGFRLPIRREDDLRAGDHIEVVMALFHIHPTAMHGGLGRTYPVYSVRMVMHRARHCGGSSYAVR